MAHETIIPGRLPDPCCGMRLYRAGPEDPGQLVEVTFWEGRQVAIVVGGEDDGLVLAVADMQGTFDPVTDFTAPAAWPDAQSPRPPLPP